MYCVCFFGSFLSIQLATYGVAEKDMGYCFLLASGPYLVSCILFPILLKNMPRKLQAVICFAVSGLSIGMMGPTRLFGLPDKLAVVLTGLFFLGFVQALSFIPVLPEVVDMLTIEYKLVEGVDEETEGLLHDTIAALYNLWYSSGSLLSPILGGFLYDKVGYKGTMDVSMFLILGLAVLYFFGNCGANVYKKTKEEMDEVKRLKAIQDKIKKNKSKDKDEEASPLSSDVEDSPTKVATSEQLEETTALAINLEAIETIEKNEEDKEILEEDDADQAADPTGTQ